MCSLSSTDTKTLRLWLVLTMYLYGLTDDTGHKHLNLRLTKLPDNMNYQKKCCGDITTLAVIYKEGRNSVDNDIN